MTDRREPAQAAGTAPADLQRAAGRVELAFAPRAGRTRLVDHLEQGCAKARFPRATVTDAGGWTMPEAVLINTAGGLTDGDSLEQHVTLGEGGRLVVTTPAAEKIYRASGGGDALVRVRLDIAAGARLLWLPQETILFDRARLRRSLDIALAPDAALLAVESLILGRTARGEAVATGSLVDERALRIDGRLVWTDRFRLAGDIGKQVQRPALLAGARALATVLIVAPDADRLLEPLRDLLDRASAHAGASWRPPVLVVRLLATDGFTLRQALLALLALLIPALDPAARLPRLWRC